MRLDFESDEQLREALKHALIDVIQEQPELFAEVLAEALENFMLTHGLHAVETAHEIAPLEPVKKMAQGA
jgi:hypothetical protein